LLTTDMRFKGHGLAPESGTGCAFLPQGVQFRGGDEERIRIATAQV